MNVNPDETERNLNWVTTMISANVTAIGFLALALFIGHRSLGFPDFGITPWHLLAIGGLGAAAIWIASTVVGRRAYNQRARGLRGNEFTEDDIEQHRLQ